MDSQKEGGFFTFIMDAIEDKALLDAFKKIESLDEFRKFFLEVNPLYGLSAEELDRIYYYRDNRKRMQI